MKFDQNLTLGQGHEMTLTYKAAYDMMRLAKVN